MALLNILFHIIIIDSIIELLGGFNILLNLIDRCLKLIELILNKLINSAENWVKKLLNFLQLYN